MKKSFFIGAGFGAAAMLLSVFGLVVLAIEIFVAPLIMIPASVVNLIMDTANTNAIITMTVMLLASAGFYGLIGMAYTKIRMTWNKRVAIGLLIVGYIVLVVVANPAFLEVGA